MTTTTHTFQSIEHQLSTVIMQNYAIWDRHPNHYGFQTFDDFLKSLPLSYYHLLNQHQQHQQVNHAQKTTQSMEQSKTIQTNSTHSSPKPVHVAAKKACIPEPKLDTISEPEPNSTQPAMTKKHGQKSGIKNGLNMVKHRVLTTLGTIDEDEPLEASTPSPHIITPNEKLNAFAHEFVPSTNVSDKYCKTEKFVPKHSARAKLNVYIPKNMTKKLLAKISEKFPNTGTLYYYLDISTAFQINDGEMNIMQKTTDGEKLVFINFDLHKKETGEILYGVIIPNDEHKIEANTQKWLWKLDRFLTAKEIKNEWDISEQDLPQSSRSKRAGLHSQCRLQQQLINNESTDNMLFGLLDEVNWTDNMLKQIGSSQKGKKNKKKQEIKVVLDQRFWMNQCRESWNEIPAIPIAVYQNKDCNEHWIEWVKLIYIPSQNSYVGISFRYNEENNKWNVESICLDKGDIRNKHRLVAINESEEFNYSQCFDKFNTNISEIQWR